MPVLVVEERHHAAHDQKQHLRIRGACEPQRGVCQKTEGTIEGTTEGTTEGTIEGGATPRNRAIGRELNGIATAALPGK